MSVVATIRIVEGADGVIFTTMEVNKSSQTENERRVASLMDRAIGAGMSAVIEHLQKTDGADASMSTGNTLDEAIKRSLENIFLNG